MWRFHVQCASATDANSNRGAITFILVVLWRELSVFACFSKSKTWEIFKFKRREMEAQTP